MKFTLKNSIKFSWDGWSGWAYNSKEDFKNARAIYVEVEKRWGKGKTTTSDRVYYIIDGEGVFEVREKKFSVKKGDVIIVPKNTVYDYWTVKGKLKLFCVHVPAFDEAGEVKI